MTHQISDTTHFEVHISANEEQQTAIELLAKNTPLSKQKLKTAMSHGAVWLESSIGTHRLRRAKKLIDENNVIHFYYDKMIQESEPNAAVLIADEGDYSIWNKPYGMYSQGTKWGDHYAIHRWVEIQLKPQRSAFTVHRLDRAASGLMIIAHTKKVATKFSELFQSRKITKHYQAIVEGTFNNVSLPHIISNEIDGKPATSIITDIEIIENNKSRVTIEIETGRKHQIRRHLSELGYPIVGDRLHGSKNHEENLQLKSCYLKFNCPISNVVRKYLL